MFCEKCGSSLVEGDKFCMKCGAPVFGAPSSMEGMLAMEGSSIPSGYGAPAKTAGKRISDWFKGLFRGSKSAAKVPVVGGYPPEQMGYPHNPGFSCDDDNSLTVVFGADSSFDEGEDSFTTVLSTMPEACFVRLRTGERLRIDAPVVLGKGSKATCRIMGNDAISRQHARVTYSNGGFYIEDMGSTNKTKVNGGMIVPNVPFALKDGAIVCLADEEFSFRIGSN